MRTLVIPSLFVVLLIAAGRLVRLNAAEVARIEAARAHASQIPKLGSFHGVGPKGLVELTPASPQYRLLFMIHADRLDLDVAYWNDIYKQTGQAPYVEWWGVCDRGHACDERLPAARFIILGFMDPYQMRIMATASDDAIALLYRGDYLAGRITLLRDVPATVRSIEASLH